jgi:hypothetical protein
MMNSDYDKFKAALDDLASRYQLAVESSVATEYFKRLARYPIELVARAMAQAPERYPTFLPNAGQLIEICDSLSVTERLTVDAVTLLRATAECEHEDQFEPEPEGALYAGFDVCVRCGRAKPVINKGAPPIQLEYFRMAVNPRVRSEE